MKHFVGRKRLAVLLFLHFLLSLTLILYRYSPDGFSHFWFAWEKLAVVRIALLLTLSFVFCHLLSFYLSRGDFKQYKEGAWIYFYLSMPIVGMAVMPASSWPYSTSGGDYYFWMLIWWGPSLVVNKWVTKDFWFSSVTEHMQPQ